MHSEVTTIRNSLKLAYKNSSHLKSSESIECEIIECKTPANNINIEVSILGV
jgi:hypothetical protein